MSKGDKVAIIMLLSLLIICVMVDIDKRDPVITSETVYVLPDSTLRKIDNIYILQVQNAKENQALRQYFDREAER
jgi:hypothetical protein